MPTGAGAPRQPAGGPFTGTHHGADHRARGRLTRFSNVKLLHREKLPGRERLFGHARDEEGAPTLLYVDYPLVAGARVPDPAQPGTDVHQAYRWPVEPFGPLIDLGPLMPGAASASNQAPAPRRHDVQLRHLAGPGGRSPRVLEVSRDASAKRILAQSGPPDLMIDAGTRTAEDQKTALLALWRHLAPGGLYVIEDGDRADRRRRPPAGSHPVTELLSACLGEAHGTVSAGRATLPGLASVEVRAGVVLLRKSGPADGVS